jgi:DNA polymerase-3 subunit delta
MEKVLANLKKGVVAPCYLLYGEEDYLISEALGGMLDILVPPGERDLSLFLMDGENADLDYIIEEIITPSLLGGRKVIVVKNTTLFHSSENAAALVAKIRDHLEENPPRAVKYFQALLNVTGLALEDLQDAGWKKISDDEWSQIVKGDVGEERGKWLPRVLELCSQVGRDGFSFADTADRFETILEKGLPGGNCLIFTAQAADKRKKIFKVVSEYGVALYFGAPRRDADRRETLQMQARRLLEENGKKMSPAAWLALEQKTGFDLRRAISELEKLIAYVGDRPVIEQSDVEEAVGRTREDDIFALTNALSQKNGQAALEALQSLLRQGVHHLIILSMMVRETRLLLQARALMDSGKLPPIRPDMEYAAFQKRIHPLLGELKTAGTGRKEEIFSQHPFVIYNALRNSAGFSAARLMDLLNDLLETEIALKSSGGDPRLLLEKFLIKACA